MRWQPAAFVLGPEDGIRLLHRMGVEGLLVTVGIANSVHVSVLARQTYEWEAGTIGESVQTVGIVNIEQNENMELARTHQFLCLALSAFHMTAPSASAAFKSRAPLQLENLALRHQLGVLRRSAKRAPPLLQRSSRRVPAGAGRPAAERGRPGSSDYRNLNYDRESEPGIINTATVRTPGRSPS